MPTAALLDLKTLQQAILHFSDEQNCIDALAAMRWPDGPVCPACSHREHWYLKAQKRWKCRECYRQFSAKLGTIFEDSPIPLSKWMVAVWMITNCKNGISYEIHRALGITQKSAWFVLHRVRLAMQNGSVMKLGGSGAPVQVDETFIGGKARNMHKDKRSRMDKMAWRNKTIVAGLLETDGKVKTHIIPNRSVASLHAVVKEHVHPGSNLNTDDFFGYWGLHQNYIHQIVDHAETYVSGKVHTNGIENFWSLLKRGLHGTYISVEPFHLFRYLDEQTFRFNNRGTKEQPIHDGQRFQIVLSQVAGKRVTYKELTGKSELPDTGTI